MLSTARRIAFILVVALLALYPTMMFGVRLAVGVVVGDGSGDHGGRPAAALGAVVFLGLTACFFRLARRRDTTGDAHAMTAYALAALVSQLIPRYSEGEGSIAMFVVVALLLMPNRRRLLDVRPQPAAVLGALAAAVPLLVVGVVRAHQVGGLKGDAAETRYDAAWIMLTIALLLVAGALDGIGARRVRLVATLAVGVIGVDSLIAPHPLFLDRPLGGYLIAASLALSFLEWQRLEQGREVTPPAETGAPRLAR